MYRVDLGLLPYEKGFFQIHHWIIDAKREQRIKEDFLFLQQYHPVVTYGRSGGTENLLLPLEEFEARGIAVHSVNRGGNVTYHGPGQLVVSPILNITHLGVGLHRYIELLEDITINVLAQYGIIGTRHREFTGVWVGDNKIAAIGVGFRRKVVFHGVALNVSPDLEPFDLIVPCGLSDKGVTSMAKLLGEIPAMASVQDWFCRYFVQFFRVHLEQLDQQELEKMIGGES